VLRRNRLGHDAALKAISPQPHRIFTRVGYYLRQSRRAKKGAMEASVVCFEDPVDEDCDRCRHCDRCPCPGCSAIASAIGCRIYARLSAWPSED
jgi:hypothetical protein